MDESDSKSQSVPQAPAYPMWVAPVEQVLRMTQLEPHQLLVKAQVMKEALTTMIIIFVSHQWLSPRHPDPDMKQFCVLQAAIRQLMQGLEVKMCPFTSAVFSQLESYFTPEHGRQLRDAFVWYDFFSIPQIVNGDEGPMQLLAIDSIPHYVNAATHFFVLAPLEICDSSGAVVSLETWSRRGWCRAEMGSHFLSQKPKPSVLCITKSDRVVETYPFAFLHNLPSYGEFTDRSDSVKIERFMGRICEERIALLESQSMFFEKRFITAMLPWLSGSRHKTDLHDWLAHYSFKEPRERVEHGWAPIHFAAVEGNLEIVSSLLAAGESADCKTAEDEAFPPLGTVDVNMQIPGMTPLMCAAFYVPDGQRAVEVAKLLLDHQASLTETCGGNETVLHLAAAGAASDGRLVRFLVERGANMEQVNGANETPILKACFLCPAGSKFPNLHSVQELVRLGSSMTGAGSVRPIHPTPLRVACGTSRLEDVKFLLEHRADPNGLGDYTELYTDDDFNMSAFPVYIRESSIKDSAEHLFGATPLHWAAYFGNAAAMELLEDWGADPEAKNYKGRTPQDVTDHAGHSGTVSASLTSFFQKRQSRVSATDDL